jgi:hypothetical protein
MRLRTSNQLILSCAKGTASSHHSFVISFIIVSDTRFFRLVVEQQMYSKTIRSLLVSNHLYSIAGLQELLEDVPTLPEHKLSWHFAIEKLLDATRDG